MALSLPAIYQWLELPSFYVRRHRHSLISACHAFCDQGSREAVILLQPMSLVDELAVGYLEEQQKIKNHYIPLGSKYNVRILKQTIDEENLHYFRAAVVRLLSTGAAIITLPIQAYESVAARAAVLDALVCLY